MKKTIERLWILLALAALVFALAACTSVKTEDPPADDTTADAAELTEGEATEPDGEGAPAVGTTAAVTDGSGCQHVWDSGKVVSEANCSATGLKLYTCTVCNQKRSEAIPKTDSHTVGFTYLAAEPTANKAAQKAGICSKCGGNAGGGRTGGNAGGGRGGNAGGGRGGNAGGGFGGGGRGGR